MSRLVCLLLLGHPAEIVAAEPFRFQQSDGVQVTQEETRTNVVRRCRRCAHTWVRPVAGRWTLAQLTRGPA